MKIEYYEIDGAYIAVDRAQRDSTGLFVAGRGGPIDSITDQAFEVRKLPKPIPAVLVPVEWQEALGLAPVVTGIKEPIYPLVGPEPPPPPPFSQLTWAPSPPEVEEDHPLVGVVISGICIAILLFIYFCT